MIISEQFLKCIRSSIGVVCFRPIKKIIHIYFFTILHVIKKILCSQWELGDVYTISWGQINHQWLDLAPNNTVHREGDAAAKISSWSALRGQIEISTSIKIPISLTLLTSSYIPLHPDLQRCQTRHSFSPFFSDFYKGGRFTQIIIISWMNQTDLRSGCREEIKASNKVLIMPVSFLLHPVFGLIFQSVGKLYLSEEIGLPLPGITWKEKSKWGFFWT